MFTRISERRLLITSIFAGLTTMSCEEQGTTVPSAAVTVTQSALSVTPGYQYQLVPAYYNYVSDQASMNALVASAASGGLHGVVVANFGNPGGPGSWPPAQANVDFVSNLQANGVPVLGYVDAAYGRASYDMLGEIGEWSWSFGADGIFFDDSARDLSDDTSEVARMLWLQNNVRSLFQSSRLPNGPLVVYNWGTDYKLEQYVYCAVHTGVPANTFVFNSFEGPETSADGPNPFVTYSPAAWISGYPATIFGNLVYGANPNGQTLAGDMNTMRRNGAAWGYATEGYPSQWSKLVGYYENPVTNAYWASERAVTNGGPYGDYPSGGTTHSYSCPTPALALINGDFSQNFVAYPHYGWEITGPTTWDSQDHIAILGSTHPFNDQGNISQVITLPSNASTLSFWVRYGCAGNGSVVMVLGDYNTDQFLANPLLTCGSSDWQFIQIPVGAWAGRDVLIEFVANGDGANAVWLDVYSVQVQ